MMKPSFARIALVLLAAGSLGLSGCRSYPAKQGQSGIVATYSGMTLTTELPDPARVPAVMAAAEETFRARGYAIKQSEVTADTGDLIAIPPRTRDYPRMIVRASNQGGGVRLTLTYQPFGDQEVCRTSLDAILKRLGM